MKKGFLYGICISLLVVSACKKKSSPPVPEPPKQVTLKSIKLNSVDFNDMLYGINLQPLIRLQFSQPIKQSTIAAAVKLYTAGGVETAVTATLQNNDSVILLQPTSLLTSISKYQFKILDGLKSASGGNFVGSVDNSFVTQIDSSRKFPAITDAELLTKVQQQTFKYFWDFGHPTSGLARERNTSGDLVTSGGSGFGAMAIITGINRNFITRAQGLLRMQTIVGFLKNTAQKFHGAFPHWLNGNTGNVIAFSAKDDGADLVETSLLMMGLLTARQYFNGGDVAETNLRNDITALYNAVEWSWFRKNNEQQLYWHWSPNFAWDMNLQIRGWNECLITYVLAASSTTFGIPKTVYDNGWARNGAAGFVNGNQYLNITLPLGSAYGGPLFLSHYSFLGINPNGLSDAYANYETQTRNHSRINYQYCVTNPNGNYGYSDSVWGLTASDIPNGYTASSPTNDVSVIAPTAAISSIPYTPTESMKALKFFYYTLGDKLFKEYGFIDAFSLKQTWFASSFLAIDQGPIIVMIENHRTGLLWNLFTSCPEVKAGMLSLGFTAPYL
ncbi:glucoamylase family protein [Lacibacter sp.]|uniref:glucoamylase family protein n=1 Tax=Lacibacter sp. TaxID=1915409 RepID=UPI002B4AF97F|nr:glucoamylase family protein [Lacibacter sp.]HLP35821.1 glucoamylase family protein [Lacibacter sp.]